MTDEARAMASETHASVLDSQIPAEVAEALEEAAAALPVDLEKGSDIAVRFEVRGKVIDLSLANRVTRRLLEGQTNKFRKKYAATVGPNGERPTIVLKKPDLVGIKTEVVLEYPEAMADSVKGHGKATRVA